MRPQFGRIAFIASEAGTTAAVRGPFGGGGPRANRGIPDYLLSRCPDRPGPFLPPALSSHALPSATELSTAVREDANAETERGSAGSPE